MFLVIADVKLKEGLEEEFRDWFSESNKILSEFDGFVSRKLLKSTDGSYRILVEHKRKETFEKMHGNEKHKKLQATAITFMKQPPIPKFYDVIASN